MQLKACFLGAAALFALAATPASAFSSRAPVTEFNLQVRWIDSLAQGPDGTISYAGTAGSREHWEGRIGRVGPAGPLGEVSVPDPFAGGIAVGPEGDAWFLVSGPTIERLTPSGSYSQAVIAAGDDFTGHATAAQGGGVWFTKGRGSVAADTVGRIGADGALKEIPLPSSESRPMAIVETSDGDAWFTELFGNRIGRVTPAGQLTEFPLPAGSRPVGITAAGDGNVWFTEQGRGTIGRIDTGGNLTEFDLPTGAIPGEIAAASDGRLWFTELASPYAEERKKLGVLGRLTPEGRFSEVRLPNRDSAPVDVVAGSEGNVWYAAMGEEPCEGGGGTCLLWEPSNPAIVGRVAPWPLTTAVTGKRAVVKRHRAAVRLACEGGKASDRCVGRIELKLAGKTVSRARYSLAADQGKAISVRVPDILIAALGRRKKVRTTAIALAADGRGSRRTIVFARGS